MALSSTVPETLSSRARHRTRSSEEACSSGASIIEGHGEARSLSDVSWMESDGCWTLHAVDTRR